MSKMSQLHAELTSQAYELGYTTLEDAFNDGWEVDYDQLRLRKVVDIQEEAHRAWLKERSELMKDADNLLSDTENYEPTAYDELRIMVNRLLEFIKKGEM